MKYKNRIFVLAVFVLCGCVSEATPMHNMGTINYIKPPYLVALEKSQEELAAQHSFQRAYIECQEYDFKLKGCDVLQKKRDTDSRAALVSQKQQQEALKESAQKIVIDEVRELNK